MTKTYAKLNLQEIKAIEQLTRALEKTVDENEIIFWQGLHVPNSV
jgi:hypothetical protein